MNRFGWVKPALAAAVVVACAVPALADETGLAAIHAQQRERGNKTCFVDHYHYGSSSGRATKKAAIASAIKSWADFTDFEYGSTWAHWGLASSKTVTCSGGDGSWGCDINARPCRKGR
ncbi:hypothetical protein RLW55_12870 [Hyphomicrobium sp. B1]|jgi:hypothetical protein|uniref:hypothetical protein n=1 Tax=unclassified Hyphomicrobium TaxID=2619925 RepID=UPI00391AE1CA